MRRDERASPLEQRFLQLVARGMSNREIADDAGYAEKTVKNVLSNVYQRYGVQNRTQALLHALAIGDVVLDDITPIPAQLNRSWRVPMSVYSLLVINAALLLMVVALLLLFRVQP